METNDKKVFEGEPTKVNADAENASYACCLALLLMGLAAFGMIYGLYKLLF
jgi:hypothetical protein